MTRTSEELQRMIGLRVEQKSSGTISPFGFHLVQTYTYHESAESSRMRLPPRAPPQEGNGGISLRLFSGARDSRRVEKSPQTRPARDRNRTDAGQPGKVLAYLARDSHVIGRAHRAVLPPEAEEWLRRHGGGTRMLREKGVAWAWKLLLEWPTWRP